MQALSSARYRHVTFADAMDLSGRPINLAPPPNVSLQVVDQSAASSSGTIELCAEERSLLNWLFARVRLDANDYRAETLARRLPACLRLLRAASASHARALLERNPSLVLPAVNALVIGVTSFFRDADVFRTIAQIVLPRITEKSCTDGHVARVWSAACSDGPELYSVAMLLAEQRQLHRCHLLGTDCRLEATQRASVGRFPAASAERDTRPALLATYFTMDEEGYYVARPCLRALLHWRTADVLHVQEPGPWDLILCRNMAMYLRGEATQRLWTALESSLRPGGYLVLGKAERPQGAAGLVPVAPCVYRRERR
jgi:chemotaxis protein methyltransferase CheR